MVTGSYKILKVYNNNAILVMDSTRSTEAVLVGKGIGFGQKVGMVCNIALDSVEKSFVAYDAQHKNDYLKLLEQFDEGILSVCAEVIDAAKQKFGALNNSVHIVLTDHVGFAIERIKAGMEIHNPFLAEIKLLYPEEYEIALKAQTLLHKSTGIHIVEDEVGFIALHLSAARQKKDVKETMKHTRLVKKLVECLEKAFEKPLKNDLTYSRLIHHLRGTIERIENGQFVVNPMLGTLKTELHESFIIAEMLKREIEQSTGKTVPDDEIGYMAIHIERLKRIVN